MIVVTAPTGNIGHQVLDHLLAEGRQVRVIARDPAKLSAGARDQAEVVQGSHGDPAVVDRALDGAEALFWLPPGNMRAATLDEVYTGFSRPVAAALRRGEVKRVVSVSALGRGTAQAAHAGQVTASLAMDDLLAATGVAFRALAMPSFMDNLLRQAGVIKERGVFYHVLPAGLRLPTVATRDIASVAARLLLDTAWSGQEEVPVLGPEDISAEDMAAVLSDVLGKPVRGQRIPARALKDRMLDAGASEAQAQGMMDMGTAKAAGLDQAVTRTPRHAQDTPTTFRRWATDVLAPAIRAA